MRIPIRRSIVVVVLLLLLTPVALFAQSETARQVVELIFSDNESSITLEDSVTSTALVTFTHDGKDYQMKVPVTIDISETIPLADSMTVTESTARVGVYGIEVVRVLETTDELKFGYFDTYKPSSDEHKLLLVIFALTNLSDTAKDFDSWFSDDTLLGIDDLGRQFENEKIVGCDEAHPGERIQCIAIFDVMKDITLAKIEVHALAERTVDVPEAQEYTVPKED